MFVFFSKGLAQSAALRTVGAALSIIFEIATGLIEVVGYLAMGLLYLGDVVLNVLAWPLEGLAWILREIFDILHMAGSPMLYMLPEYIAKGFTMMGDAAKFLGDMLQWPIKALGFLWDIFHKPGSDMLYELPNYFASALGAASSAASVLGTMLTSPAAMLREFADSFASIKGDILEMATGMTSLISVIKEFADLDFDGFIAVRSEGGATSMVMGSEGIIKQMSEGKLTVDVNMPEIKLPEINIEINFVDAKLEGIIDARIAEKVGGAG